MMGPLCSNITLSRGKFCFHVSRSGELLISHNSFLREPLFYHNGCRWEFRFNLCIFVRKPLFYYSVDVRKLLLDRVVLVREPLLIRVACLAEEREICVICARKNSTSSAERAIACSIHRLRRGFAIHYCNIGPITWDTKRWVNTSMTSNLRRRLTDLSSQSICTYNAQPWHAQYAIECIIHLDHQEISITAEAVKVYGKDTSRRATRVDSVS